VKAFIVDDPIQLTSLAQDLNIWITSTNAPPGGLRHRPARRGSNDAYHNDGATARVADNTIPSTASACSRRCSARAVRTGTGWRWTAAR
jgi:hypothetical protein